MNLYKVCDYEYWIIDTDIIMNYKSACGEAEPVVTQGGSTADYYSHATKNT